eukprot:2579439-Pyramimonas_sp.AAC.1
MIIRPLLFSRFPHRQKARAFEAHGPPPMPAANWATASWSLALAADLVLAAADLVLAAAALVLGATHVLGATPTL